MGYDSRALGVGGLLLATGVLLIVGSISSLSNCIRHWKHLKYEAVRRDLLIVLAVPVMAGWAS